MNAVRHPMPHVCGNLCGSKLLILLGCAPCAASRPLSRACVCAREKRPRIRKRKPHVCVYMPHMPHMPHTPQHINDLRDTSCRTHAAQMPHTPSIHFFSEKEGMVMKRRILCTEENAKEVQALVKRDADLLALVKGLQEQGMFPGLRAMVFTIEGDEQTIAKGLAAWPVKNGAEAPEGGAK